MFLTDTHTHLFAAEFDEDRKALIEAAKSAGVTRYFLPNIDSSSIDSLLAVCKEYPGSCFPITGLHPCSVKEDFEEQLEKLFALTSDVKFYAIGEIGIDLYWDKTFVEQQKKAFILQIEKAVELDLPVVIHSRESFDLIVELIHQTYQKNNWAAGTLRGIFHCFTGTVEQSRAAVDLGFYLGIGGVLTFKNSGLDKVVEQIDIHKLVLETDAPYLAPAPFRGKRNIPEYLVTIAEKLSSVKNISLEETARITSVNASAIFRTT